MSGVGVSDTCFDIETRLKNDKHTREMRDKGPMSVVQINRH